MVFRLLCFYSAHWAYSPDSSLRRHNVLSETQQFWRCGSRINLSGGAVSSHKRSAEAGPEMRRRFSRDVGSRRWCTSAAGTATPEAERFHQSTIDPAGRRGGPGSTGSNEAARQLHNLRRWCTSAAGTATPEAEWFRQSTIDPAGRRGRPGSTGSNEAARQLHNRRRWCTSAAGTATPTPFINGDSTG